MPAAAVAYRTPPPPGREMGSITIRTTVLVESADSSRSPSALMAPGFTTPEPVRHAALQTLAADVDAPTHHLSIQPAKAYRRHVIKPRSPRYNRQRKKFPSEQRTTGTSLTPTAQYRFAVVNMGASNTVTGDRRRPPRHKGAATMPNASGHRSRSPAESVTVAIAGARSDVDTLPTNYRQVGIRYRNESASSMSPLPAPMLKMIIIAFSNFHEACCSSPARSSQSREMAVPRSAAQGKRVSTSEVQQTNRARLNSPIRRTISA